MKCRYSITCKDRSCLCSGRKLVGQSGVSVWSAYTIFIYLFIYRHLFIQIAKLFFFSALLLLRMENISGKKQQHVFAISNRDRAELAERHPGPHLQSDILGHIKAEPNRCLSVLLIRFRLTHLCLVGSSALSLWLGPFPNWECLAGLCCCRVLLGFLSLCRQCRP